LTLEIHLDKSDEISSLYRKITRLCFVEWWDLLELSGLGSSVLSDVQLAKDIKEGKEKEKLRRIVEAFTNHVEMELLSPEIKNNEILKEICMKLVELLVWMETNIPPLKFIKPRKGDKYNPALHQTRSSPTFLVVNNLVHPGLMTTLTNFVLVRSVVESELFTTN